MSSTPYTKTLNTLAPEGAFSWYRSQFGFKSTGVDRSTPKPYALTEAKVKRWQTRVAGGTYYSPKNPTTRSLHNHLPFSGSHQGIRNRAYEDFRSAVTGDSAAIGAALAEAGDSLGMIQKRATGLYRAYRALRKGDFRKCLNELSVSPKRKHRNLVRNGAHEASGLWLEYWFGWSPMVNDIGTAYDQLSSPLPVGQPTRGRAGGRDTISGSGQQVESFILVETGATATLINPNAYLASQLGLVNPALVAWEVVPFSFLADWCFDVSSFLGSYSDFVGIQLSDVYTTEMVRAIWTIKPYPGFTVGDYVSEQVFMERRTELIRPLPNFEVLGNLGTSVTRAASAVSLLTQILRV